MGPGQVGREACWRGQQVAGRGEAFCGRASPQPLGRGREAAHTASQGPPGSCQVRRGPGKGTLAALLEITLWPFPSSFSFANSPLCNAPHDTGGENRPLRTRPGATIHSRGRSASSLVGPAAAAAPLPLLLGPVLPWRLPTGGAPAPARRPGTWAPATAGARGPTTSGPRARPGRTAGGREGAVGARVSRCGLVLVGCSWLGIS
jgi:hypothetical protein